MSAGFYFLVGPVRDAMDHSFGYHCSYFHSLSNTWIRLPCGIVNVFLSVKPGHHPH